MWTVHARLLFVPYAFVLGVSTLVPRPADGANRRSFFFGGEAAQTGAALLAPSIAVQWEASPGLDFGAAVRLPAFSIYGWGDRSPLAASVTVGGEAFSAERTSISEWDVSP